MTRRAWSWSGSPSILNDAAAIISDIRLARFPLSAWPLRQGPSAISWWCHAMARSLKGTPGLKNGTTGHCHGTVGFGITGKVPFAQFNTGYPANLLTGVSDSSSAEAGNSIITNFTIYSPPTIRGAWQLTRHADREISQTLPVSFICYSRLWIEETKELDVFVTEISWNLKGLVAIAIATAVRKKSLAAATPAIWFSEIPPHRERELDHCSRLRTPPHGIKSSK